uniref:Uncharacterized protein n=1 Tax=Hordeum vulgare subsp. vulgare TaxID=112509 RepID=A0A8I6Y096_HORVV
MSLRVVGVSMDHTIWREGCRQNCTTPCRFYGRLEDIEVPTSKQAVELLTLTYIMRLRHEYIYHVSRDQSL